MKNLLIGKSFSYEIVDFTLLWQSNAYRLGGSCYIHLTKGTASATISIIQKYSQFCNYSVG